MNFDLDPGDFILMTESIPKSYVSDTSDVNNNNHDTMDKFNLSTVQLQLQPLLENDSLIHDHDMQWEYIGFGISGTRSNTKILHYCFGTLLILIGCCGVIGNGLVLYVFTRFTRRLRGGGSTLILSLATGDFLVSVLHFMPAYASFHEQWTFGDRGCEIYAAMVGQSGMASLLTLSAIAADRYGVIIGQPLLWLSAKKTCAAIWCFCLILTTPPFFGWSRYVKEGLETSCSWDYKTRDWNNRSYYIFLLLFGFTIPVVIIIYSYVGIIHVIYKHSKKMSGVTRNGIIHNKKRLTKSDIRTAQVILTIIICFLTSWTPYALVSLVGQFGDERGLSPLATALPAVFAKASVVYNPIVYGLSHPHFRSAIRMLKARHFPNNSSINRASGPYDRNQYYPGGHLNSMKRSGERKSFNEGQRHHNHNNNNNHRHRHRNYRHWQQRNGRDAVGLFRQPSNSQHQQSDGGENSRTFEMSRSSGGGGGQDIMVNRKGWTVVRRLSPQFDSDTLQSSVIGTGNGEPISESCDPVSQASHSEPDLVQRDENGKVKLAECINMCEYGREKNLSLRKAFFRSESCLQNVLVKGNRENGMAETDLTYSRNRKNNKSRKCPHSIVKKSMIVFSTAGIGTNLNLNLCSSSNSSSSTKTTVQTSKCSCSSKHDLTLDEDDPSPDECDGDRSDGGNCSKDVCVTNDCQHPVPASVPVSYDMTEWAVSHSPSDSSDASSCCNDRNRESGSTSSISNILCVAKNVTKHYGSTNTNTNTNIKTKTNGHHNKKKRSNEKVGASFMDLDINAQTKTDELKQLQALSWSAIHDGINTNKNSNKCSSNGNGHNCKSRRRAFWYQKSISAFSSPSSSSPSGSGSSPLLSTSSPSFKSKLKIGRKSKKWKCSTSPRHRLTKTGGNNELQDRQQELERTGQNPTFELEFDGKLPFSSSLESLQQQQQYSKELDTQTQKQNTVHEFQKCSNELGGEDEEKITSFDPAQTNDCQEYYEKDDEMEMATWKMTLTNEYQQRPSFKLHKQHVTRELSRISSESEEDEENEEDQEDGRDDEEICTRIPSTKKLNEVQKNGQRQRMEYNGDSEDEDSREQDEILSVHTPTNFSYTCER